MTLHRDKQATMPQYASPRLFVMLLLVISLTGIVVGCSTESRHRIKTVIFTGVPPLQIEQPTEETGQPDAAQPARAEQLARQQQIREARAPKFWQHGPFAAGECHRCHSLGRSTSFFGNRDTITEAPAPVASVSASSRLLLPPAQLCATCHSHHAAPFVKDLGLQQHLPAAAGLCMGCHNPHQSQRRYMLLKADNQELCGGCHNPQTLSPVHGENPEKGCVDCHNAHVGVTRKLLRSDAKELALLYGDGGDE